MSRTSRADLIRQAFASPLLRERAHRAVELLQVVLRRHEEAVLGREVDEPTPPDEAALVDAVAQIMTGRAR